MGWSFGHGDRIWTGGLFHLAESEHCISAQAWSCGRSPGRWLGLHAFSNTSGYMKSQWQDIEALFTCAVGQISKGFCFSWTTSLSPIGQPKFDYILYPNTDSKSGFTPQKSTPPASCNSAQLSAWRLAYDMRPDLPCWEHNMSAQDTQVALLASNHRKTHTISWHVIVTSSCHQSFWDFALIQLTQQTWAGKSQITASSYHSHSFNIVMGALEDKPGIIHIHGNALFHCPIALGSWIAVLV